MVDPGQQHQGTAETTGREDLRSYEIWLADVSERDHGIGNVSWFAEEAERVRRFGP